MTDQKPTPDEVLAEWENCPPEIIDANPHEFVGDLAEALREAVRQRDKRAEQAANLGTDLRTVVARLTEMEKQRNEVRATLKRLAAACYPLDLWLGGVLLEPLSDQERHEFVLALSAAYQASDSGEGAR